MSATAADPLIIDMTPLWSPRTPTRKNVAGTYKGGYGFALFIASCDYGAGNGSGEILSWTLLRPGNGGATSAEDHIRVFHTAVTQLPDRFFNDTVTLAAEKVLFPPTAPGPHGSSSLAPAQPRRAAPPVTPSCLARHT